MSTIALQCSVGDLFVTGGFLRLRQRGNWTAHLQCASLDAPTGSAQLVIRRENGTLDTFVGTIRRAGVVQGSKTLDVTLVGGAGQLLNQLPVRDYVTGTRPIPAEVIAAGIVADAGEQLAPGVEAALDAVTLPRWHRAKDITAAVALDLLANELGMSWRVQPDGRLWIGIETWPAVNGASRWVGADPDDGRVMYAPDGAPLLAGQAIDGVNAIEVMYTFASSALRASVRGAVAGDPPHRLDLDLYRASYDAEVKAQRPDGTLDLACEDDRIGELLAVPFRMGIPGAKVTIPVGSWVRLQFVSASPSGAYASDVDQDDAATKPFALVGDTAGFLSGSAGGTPVTFAISPTATGAPGEVGITILGPGHKYAKGVSG